ncbi:hypothetical protein D3C85_1645130 [compost metagenome]
MNSIIVIGIETAHWRVSVLCDQSKCAATLPHPEITDKEIFKKLTRTLGPPVEGLSHAAQEWGEHLYVAGTGLSVGRSNVFHHTARTDGYAMALILNLAGNLNGGAT